MNMFAREAGAQSVSWGQAVINLPVKNERGGIIDDCPS
jgi:hypothetical protein